jgi:starch synthase
MQILFVTSEAFPLIKTGGLADVSSALPAALRALGMDVRLLLPAYPAAVAAAGIQGPAIHLGEAFEGRPVSVLKGQLPGSAVPVLLVDSPGLYDRPGTPYQNESGSDWPDNEHRFGLLSWAAARLSQPNSPLGWQPDVLHLNDWPAGLAPAYLFCWGGERPRTIFTIHNIAYQGNFPAPCLSQLALEPRCFALDGLEFHGQISFLKAGLYYADRITTVSPTYANEIRHPPLGCGFEGLLTKRRADLWGILNGADYTIWDPRRDSHLVKQRTPDDFAAKAEDKRTVQHTMGLAEKSSAPLFVVVSRLVEQKGMDLVLAAIPTMLRLGGQLAVLGSGDKGLELSFANASAANPSSVAVHVGYSEPLAHRLISGGDFLLMPSRAEPCGLTQIYALRYGTIPIVHRVGGLADTVVDASYDAMLEHEATGFVFDEPAGPGLDWSIERAVTAYHTEEERRCLQLAGVRQDFSWASAARRYLDLYREVRPNE